MEYWSIGVMGGESQYSITPVLQRFILLLQYSILYCAFLLCDVRFKLIAKFFNECRRGHGCRIAEETDRVAHDIAAYVEDQIKIARFPFTILDAVKDLFHPMATFAARAALAARFVGEETRDVPSCVHHAGRIVHDDDPTGTEQTAGRRHRFVIEVDLFDFLRPQHRHRGAAGNDGFEFSTVRDAATVFIEEFLKRITQVYFVNTGLCDVAADAEQLGSFALFRSNRRIRLRPDRKSTRL